MSLRTASKDETLRTTAWHRHRWGVAKRATSSLRCSRERSLAWPLDKIRHLYALSNSRGSKTLLSTDMMVPNFWEPTRRAEALTLRSSVSLRCPRSQTITTQCSLAPSRKINAKSVTPSISQTLINKRLKKKIQDQTIEKCIRRDLIHKRLEGVNRIDLKSKKRMQSVQRLIEPNTRVNKP